MENKPVKKIRMGVVCATIWSNMSKEGKKFPSISLERLYKDNGSWKSTSSLRQGDLLGASVVLTEAFKYLGAKREDAVA